MGMMGNANVLLLGMTLTKAIYYANEMLLVYE